MIIIIYFSHIPLKTIKTIKITVKNHKNGNFVIPVLFAKGE